MLQADPKRKARSSRSIFFSRVEARETERHNEAGLRQCVRDLADEARGGTARAFVTRFVAAIRALHPAVMSTAFVPGEVYGSCF
jgi:hypothetical protein